jgi:hypothetical protein
LLAQFILLAATNTRQRRDSAEICHVGAWREVSGRRQMKYATDRFYADLLRFRANSKVTGCSTGSSAGSAPLNILST